MTGSVHRRYLKRWIAITIAAGAVVAFRSASAGPTEPLVSVLGILFAGAVDGAVFFVLARTLIHTPDRFMSAWLRSLVAKFLALGGGCVLAWAVASEDARSFAVATALSFAAFVTSDAVSLAALCDRPSTNPLQPEKSVA